MLARDRRLTAAACGVVRLDAADVAAHPLLENIDEELSVTLWADRSRADSIVALALDDRNQLDIAGVEHISQEPVDPSAVALVRCMHTCEHVPIDTARFETVKSRDHPPAFGGPCAG